VDSTALLESFGPRRGRGNWIGMQSKARHSSAQDRIAHYGSAALESFDPGEGVVEVATHGMARASDEIASERTSLASH